MSMIEVQGLWKRYGALTAVRGLSFDVQPGRVTGLLGPNGAGKSTTLRMILGLETPTAGRALVDGRPYRRLPQPLRTAGALLDAGAASGGRTARAHLQWLAASNDLPASRVSATLEWAGLADVAGRRVGTFSLGMKQRLGIAAALLGDPRCLLLDEPVNGLDPDGVLWMRRLLRSVADDGRTVLISSHLISELELVADHLIILGRGRLLADAPLAELLASAGPTEVLVHTPEPNRLAELLRAHAGVVEQSSAGALIVTGLSAPQVGAVARSHHVLIDELATRRPSLERAYLDLTEAARQYPAGPDCSEEGVLS